MIAEANPGSGFRGGEQVVIPLKRANKAGVYPDGYQTVPILTYHRFSDDCPSPLCMPTAVFKQQMRYLKKWLPRPHAGRVARFLGIPAAPAEAIRVDHDRRRLPFGLRHCLSDFTRKRFYGNLVDYTELIDVAPIALHMESAHGDEAGRVCDRLPHDHPQ